MSQSLQPLGVGTDLVEVARLRAALDRRPALAGRLFTDEERRVSKGRADPARGLAARFAAKEAAMKALGLGLGGLRFRDVEVIREPSGAPSLRLHGPAAERARRCGVRSWKVSLTHTESLAQAVVLALGEGAVEG